jgi:lysophospholipase L1-like esterase
MAIADEAQNERIAELVGYQRQICEGFEIPYLDVFTLLRRSPVWMAEVRSGGGAHPNAAGYAELARLVLSWSAWWKLE